MAWDGIGRIDSLFTHTIPLDVAPDLALTLARVFAEDFTAKLRGELRPQRVLIAVTTEQTLDLANMLMGEHGHVHTGVVTAAHLLQFARQGVVLVQVGIDAIANHRHAAANLANLFAPLVFNPATNRKCPTPMFIGVGRAPGDARTSAQIDERCLLLRARAAPSIADFEPLLVEAWHKRGETPVPAEVRTVAQAEVLEGARTALEIIYDYAVKEPTARGRMGSGEAIRCHVVRSLCLTEMRGRWSNAWRDTPAQERAFNHACRAMGWFKAGAKVSLSLRDTAARNLGIDPGDRAVITVPGVLLTDERLAALKAYLFGDGDLPPYGGQPPSGCNPYPERNPVENPRETAASTRNLEALYAREAMTNDRNCSRARDAYTREAPYLEGDAAVEAVRTVLAEPGPCALDFETYPTTTSWHGDQAALAAPRGKKGEAPRAPSAPPS